MLPTMAQRGFRHRRATAAAGFAPIDVAGLKVWWEADALALGDGAAVSTFTDASGQANHGTGVNSPVYKTGIVNGKAVVRFAAASLQYFTLPNAFTGLTAATAFLVIKKAADPAAADPNSGLWYFGSGGNNTHFPYTDGNVYDEFGTDSRKSTGNPTLDLSTAFRCYTVKTASGEWTSRINGAQHFTTATNTVGFGTTPQLGKNVGAIYLDGDVAAFLIYDSNLTGTDLSNVESYLSTKYALGF